MGKLSNFLPLDRRRALLAGVPLPDRTRGSALFADVSGFTELTSVLHHELGPRRGAEELVGHIDHVSSILIGEVHSHHGVVISFSGDGIACWFEEPDADTGAFLPVSAERAVRCGLRMQEAINRLQAFATPSGKRFPIGVKVAVTTGPARRFLVGDPETYVIEVLAGKTVDRLANAGTLAGRGEGIRRPGDDRDGVRLEWRPIGLT